MPPLVKDAPEILWLVHAFSGPGPGKSVHNASLMFALIEQFALSGVPPPHRNLKFLQNFEFQTLCQVDAGFEAVDVGGAKDSNIVW